MDEIFESPAIYRVEYQLILNVQEFRIQRGWSQRILSKKMGFVETFVGKCESLNQPEKYNLRHIGILKTVFGFEKLDELFPNGIPSDELIKIRYRKTRKETAGGRKSKLFDNEIVEIVVVGNRTKGESNKYSD